MKKFLLTIACSAVAALTFGQKEIAVTLNLPATNDVITQGVAFDLDFTVTNNGPDDLVVEDTVYFGLALDGQLVTQGVYAANRTTGTIAAGGSFTYTTDIFSFPQLGDNNQHSFCVVVLLADSDSSYNFVSETDMTNNQSCNDIQFAGSTASTTEFGQVVNAISAFPNPATSTVNFEVSTGAEEIVIYDVNGKAVRTVAVENEIETVDVSDLENGVYFYAVRFENGEVKQERLVVSK
ncbi:Por secretion system C-terminal sorting domain-containing protein [Lishizhenia tianjinensis]|uniref:Por secretion system C-terminal sorting domain-containing protein n=1 Tax=Lishizhenia tianjinensis TaxID=477690 RepID=A0A1I6YS77_9FLAO|nr:T9SS type A sorting domain-containing protein [Lishizhenia tianjinensis]SFT53238.1 Por secretion system C-terminal sorting domain-containing protein [Lishizhenia tianjinensis]